MPTYELVNPILKGDFDRFIKADDETTAAGKMWERVSANLDGKISKFGMSLKSDEDDYSHYIVKEHRTDDDNTIDFEVKKINNEDISPKMFEDFRLKLEAAGVKYQTHKGGRIDYNEDDEDDIDDIDGIDDIGISKQKLKKYKRIHDSLKGDRKYDVYMASNLTNFWYYPCLYNMPILQFPVIRHCCPVVTLCQPSCSVWW